MDMAWNEPGGSGNKDPWGGGGRNNNDQGPPDLDEVIKNFQNKLGGIFGKKGGGSSGGSDIGGGEGPSGGMIAGILVVALIVWMFTGIYIVQEGERGVVTRFGKYIDTTMPGPHWHIPSPVDSVTKVKVDENRASEIGFREKTSSGRSASHIPKEALMLTQDENIVDIKFVVQYNVSDAKNYLFNVRDPDLTLQQATESAVREVIGKSKMDFVLTEGQSDIADRAEILLQKILDRYETGLNVISVNLQSAQPPQEVKHAFEDAIKAREDQQRLINNAEAYSNDIIPKARGNAARQLEESNGYKARVVARAEGEADRFSSLLTEYKRAPQVTRQRLYLETMEEVLSNTTKVMLDVKGGNNLLYLPLDKLIPEGSSARSINMDALPSSSSEPVRRTQREIQDRRQRQSLRERGGQ